MKAFVTFIRTLFNSSSASAGGRASQQRFLSRVRWQGLARALFVLLAALLLGTGLSVLQACNGQPQPAAQPDVRAGVWTDSRTGLGPGIQPNIGTGAGPGVRARFRQGVRRVG